MKYSRVLGSVVALLFLSLLAFRTLAEQRFGRLLAQGPTPVIRFATEGDPALQSGQSVQQPPEGGERELQPDQSGQQFADEGASALYPQQSPPGGNEPAVQPTTSVQQVAQMDGDESPATGTIPSSGLWRGNITNSLKGQTISFRVSSDGTTISEVAFKGYLSCDGNRRIEDTELAPLNDTLIESGGFEDTQLNGGAKVRFDFTGTFTSTTTAEGTYRVMCDTTCDTYKLTWTASRVEN